VDQGGKEREVYLPLSSFDAVVENDNDYVTEIHSKPQVGPPRSRKVSIKQHLGKYCHSVDI